MTAHKINLQVDRGATLSDTHLWKLDGVPVNLTACTARMQVRQRTANDPVLLDLTTANGRLVLGGSLGTVQVLVADDVTALAKSGVYDLFIDFPSGASVCLMAGDFTVNPRVTVL